MIFEIKEDDLLKYEKSELNLLTDESDDVKLCVLKLCEKLHEQGHSGMSVGIVVNTFITLVKSNEPVPEYLFTKEGDFYGGMTGKAVQELIDVYEAHCKGCDKNKVMDYFQRLAFFKPLTPLTFEDDEWVLDSEYSECYQNRRDFSVFKEGRDGRPYTIDAYYVRNQKGQTFYTSLNTPKGKVGRCYIKDSANMPRVCIDVIDFEIDQDTGKEKEGTGWWKTVIKDMNQLEELEKYYDVEYV